MLVVTVLKPINDVMVMSTVRMEVMKLTVIVSNHKFYVYIHVCMLFAIA